MFAWLKAQALSFLSVPPEPEPPAGSQGSLLVFRASPAYLRYRLALWGLGRLASLLIGLSIASALLVPAFLVAKKMAPAPAVESREPEPGPIRPRQSKGIAAQVSPAGVTAVFVVLGGGVLVWFLAHAAVSYVLLRLDYELRWYKVTDRSLRIREGVWTVRELTMSFANIQNISFSQGPLQKYFGVSDLMVESAGGGAPQPGVESLHRGYFRGVDNAEQIRAMMLERLRALKDGGLGDHDDHRLLPASPPGPGAEGQNLALAPSPLPEALSAELAALSSEARGLRAAAERLERARARASAGV